MFDQIRKVPHVGWGGGSGFSPTELSGPDGRQALRNIDEATVVEKKRREGRPSTSTSRSGLSLIFDVCKC